MVLSIFDIEICTLNMQYELNDFLVVHVRFMNSLALLWYAPCPSNELSCITHSLFSCYYTSIITFFNAESMATCSDNEIMNIMFLY